MFLLSFLSQEKANQCLKEASEELPQLYEPKSEPPVEEFKIEIKEEDVKCEREYAK